MERKFIFALFHTLIYFSLPTSVFLLFLLFLRSLDFHGASWVNRIKSSININGDEISHCFIYVFTNRHGVDFLIFQICLLTSLFSFLLFDKLYLNNFRLYVLILYPTVDTHTHTRTHTHSKKHTCRTKMQTTKKTQYSIQYINLHTHTQYFLNQTLYLHHSSLSLSFFLSLCLCSNKYYTFLNLINLLTVARVCAFVCMLTLFFLFCCAAITVRFYLSSSVRFFLYFSFFFYFNARVYVVLLSQFVCISIQAVIFTPAAFHSCLYLLFILCRFDFFPFVFVPFCNFLLS